MPQMRWVAASRVVARVSNHCACRRLRPVEDVPDDAVHAGLTAANGVGGGVTFKLSGLTLSGPRGAGAPDIALLFNEAASCTPASVTLVVT